MYRISPIAKPELTCVEMNDVARWARLLRQRSGFKSDIFCRITVQYFNLRAEKLKLKQEEWTKTFK